MIYDCTSQLTRKEKLGFFCGIKGEIKCSPEKNPGFKDCIQDSIQGQVAWGFEQSKMVEDIPVMSKEGLGDL